MKKVLLVFIISIGSFAQQVKINLVNVKEYIPSIMVEMKYFTSDNFVGEVIDGYKANKCLLTSEAATALKTAQNLAQKRGFSLLVHDCYRPQRGVNHFISWSKQSSNLKTKSKFYPNLKKENLFDLGYIAKKSGHSRGSTVDLTLYDLKNKTSVNMGTIYDFLDPLSNTINPKIPKKILSNRKVLVDIMKLAGFKNYSKEWWHYTLENEPNKETYLDDVIK